MRIGGCSRLENCQLMHDLGVGREPPHEHMLTTFLILDSRKRRLAAEICVKAKAFLAHTIMLTLYR